MDWENLFHINLRNMAGQYRTTNTFGFPEESWGHCLYDWFLESWTWPFSFRLLWIQGISPMVWSLSRFEAHFPNFCWIYGWAVATSAEFIWFRLSCYHFSYFVASLYLTSDFVFESLRYSRHSFRPPSSFDWMDLATAMIQFFTITVLALATDHSSSQGQYPTDQREKEKSHPLGKEYQLSIESKTRAHPLVFLIDPYTLNCILIIKHRLSPSVFP